MSRQFGEEEEIFDHSEANWIAKTYLEARAVAYIIPSYNFIKIIQRRKYKFLFSEINSLIETRSVYDFLISLFSLFVIAFCQKFHNIYNSEVGINFKNLICILCFIKYSFTLLYADCFVIYYFKYKLTFFS